RQRDERRVGLLVREAQPSEDGPRLSLETVAAERLEAVAQVAVAGGEARQQLRRGARGELDLDPLDLLLDVADLSEPGKDVTEDRRALERLDLLGQVADSHALGERDLARIGRFLSRENAQERRLARAVGPHEADPHAHADVPGEIVEDGLR